MLAAIRRLWELHDSCFGDPERIRRKYEDFRIRQDKKYEALEGTLEQMTYLETTIHYQRRIITHFYNEMLKAIDIKILPKKYALKFWSLGALEIMPKVIQPISLDNDKELMRLYNMAPRRRL